MPDDNMQAAPVSFADAAAALARQGFRVFPCAENGKRPVWEGWPEWASADEATVRGWWGARHYNVGILTDDMVVVDIDTKPGKDGMASWMSLHGGFDTLTVRTPSGGYHLYYTGANVAINQGALGPGLDVRSYHGYVLGPGSQIDGKTYAVEIAAPKAQVPAAVLARCKPPGQKAANAQQSLVEADDPRAIALATQAVMSHAGATAGELSQAAYQLACRVRDYGISEGVCQVIMAPWGARCQPPVIGEDLNGRIANAYLYAQNPMGSKNPVVMFGKVNIPPVPETNASTKEAAAAQAERSGLRLVSPDECADTAPRSYVIKNMLAPGQLGCVFGAPGAGKSVLAPHLAYAVARGRPVFGQRTKPGTVFYVAAEDEAGMRQRIHALRRRHGAADNFRLVVGMTSLGDPASGDLERLRALIAEHRPALIVIDTLAAAAPGLRENEAEHMGVAVAAMRSLTQQGAAVLLVHHSPKSGDTPRGHSVLNGALDVSMLVAPDEAIGGARGQLQKNRNGPCSLAIAFRIEAEALDRDEDGDNITAPVCVETTAAELRTARTERTTKTEAKAEGILIRLATARRPPTAPPGDALPAVPLLDWEQACMEQGAVSVIAKPGGRRRQFQGARDGLVQKVRIRIDNGTVQPLTWGTPPAEDHAKLHPLVGSMAGPLPKGFAGVQLPPT
jgi:hypothetical protein